MFRPESLQRRTKQIKSNNKKNEEDIEWQSKPINELKINQDKVHEFIKKYNLDQNATAEDLMSTVYKIDPK